MRPAIFVERPNLSRRASRFTPRRRRLRKCPWVCWLSGASKRGGRRSPDAPAEVRVSSRKARVLKWVAAVAVLILGSGLVVAFRRDSVNDVRGALVHTGLERLVGDLPDEVRARMLHQAESGRARIDRMGPKGAQAVVALLTDDSKARADGTSIDVGVQELAHAYLLYFASVQKLKPPPLADDIGVVLARGRRVPADQWEELQRAWSALLTGPR